MENEEQEETKSPEPNRVESIICIALGRVMITPYNWSLVVLTVLILGFGSLTTYAASANSNLELRTDMSEEELRKFNAALKKVQQAVRDGKYTTSNNEDARLAESLRKDLITQDQIAKDIAKKQQEIDTYTNQINYAKTHSEIINRAFNKALLNEIIARNPEINSKEQALTWARSHKVEADAIAKDVRAKNSPFETPEYKAWLENRNK